MCDKEVLGILRHSLGLNPDGTGSAYRNHFVAGLDHEDLPVIERAVRDGLMVRGKAPKFYAESDLTFHVTDAGRHAVGQSLLDEANRREGWADILRVNGRLPLDGPHGELKHGWAIAKLRQQAQRIMENT